MEAFGAKAVALRPLDDHLFVEVKVPAVPIFPEVFEVLKSLPGERFDSKAIYDNSKHTFLLDFVSSKHRTELDVAERRVVEDFFSLAAFLFFLEVDRSLQDLVA